jgi:hypothetical protein
MPISFRKTEFVSKDRLSKLRDTGLCQGAIADESHQTENSAIALQTGTIALQTGTIAFQTGTIAL